MLDSNLPTEIYEELLISIRNNYSRKSFLIRSLFGKIKKLVGSMRDNLQAAKVLYGQNSTAS